MDREKRKIKAESIYIDFGNIENKKNEVLSLLHSLFEKTTILKAGKNSVEYLYRKRNEVSRYILVLDCRNGANLVDAATREMQNILEVTTPSFVMVVFDKESSAQIYRLGAFGTNFFLEFPWTKNSLARIFQKISAAFMETSREKGYRNRVKKCLAEKAKESQICKSEIDKCRETLRLKENFFITKTHEIEKLANQLADVDSLLLQKSTDKKEMEYLGKRMQYLRRLQEGIHEIFDFLSEKGIAGKKEKRFFNINTVLDSVIGVVGVVAKERGIELIFDIDNNVPARVEGDPVVVERVIVNMIGGAIDSGDIKEIVLKISIQENQDEDKILLVEMVDTANLLPGANKDEMMMALKTGKFALSGELAESLGGSLGIDIKEKKKRIVFALPTEAGERRSYRLPSRKWMSRKILIVEDNDQALRALKRMLDYFHFDTVAVNSDKDALKLMYENLFDLIFIDEKIFDKCAVECVSRKKLAKIILLERESEFGKGGESARRMMADTVLAKPYTQQRIFNVIMELYSRDNIEGIRETLDILREDIKFLVDGKKVIYIGRNTSDREIIETLIKDTGILLTTAARLTEVAANISFADLIFIDSEEWESEEWEKLINDCRKLVAGKTIKIIAVIPQIDNESLEKAKDLGVTTFIFKPIDPEKFYMVMLEYLVPESNG